LISRIKNFSSILTHALMPAFSELSSAGEGERLKTVFMVSSRFVVAIFAVMIVGAAMLGAEFISLWIGPEYGERGREVLWCLVAYVVASSLVPAASRFLTAIDRHGILAKVAIVEAAANLALSVALVFPFGVVGVALGSAISATCVAPVVWRAVMRHLGIASMDYFRAVLWPSALAAACMVGGVLLADDILWTTGWAGLAKSIVIGTAVYCAAFMAVGVSKAERARIVAILRGRSAIGG